MAMHRIAMLAEGSARQRAEGADGVGDVSGGMPSTRKVSARRPAS
jgi:hypothetical protein